MALGTEQQGRRSRLVAFGAGWERAEWEFINDLFHDFLHDNEYDTGAHHHHGGDVYNYVVCSQRHDDDTGICAIPAMGDYLIEYGPADHEHLEPTASTVTLSLVRSHEDPVLAGS